MNTTRPFDWRDESEDHLLFGDSDMDFFFEEGYREQCVDQLLKLSQLDEAFVFLLGPTGIGKTSLLREFIRRQPDNVSCAYIEVPILVDTITLLDNIAKQYDIAVPINSDIEYYIHSIRHFIQAQQYNDRQFILMIDDADGLPNDTLRALLKLISKTRSPHFIFSGHGIGLQNRINALIPSYQTHTIELEPLSEAEVVSYVELYLSAYHIENNFSDDDIYDIFLSSNGNMGEINKLINRSVDDELQADNSDYLERAQKISTLQIPRVHIAAVITAILALGALSIYFMNHTNPTSTTNQVAPASQPQPIDTRIVTAPKESISPAPNASVQQGQIIQAAPTVTPASPPKVTTSITPQPTTKTSASSTAGWLVKAPASHFTLQMMGSFSKDAVTKLVNQQNDTKLWAYYQTTRDGKPWFVAVYGNYASKEAAKAAADKLPPGLKEGKPWPKAIGDIHNEMKR